MNRRKRFGPYELDRRISVGGMAEVFLAIHTPSNRQVALKRILPQASEDEEFLTMFEDEARIASQLEHPYIARCLDFGHVEDDWFIAFEYVDGKDLRALFNACVKAGERPPLGFFFYVFTRIAEGLAYAHARKDDSGAPVSIVHRDVSPQNIVVSFEGDVKLIDFGIAKAAGRLSRTEAGVIKGKFGYMSPEQASGGAVDQRTDVFSLGVCMWEMLTGRRLFHADNEVLVLQTLRRPEPVEPPSVYGRACPPAVDRIVLKALAKAADERYRSAKDVYRDLTQIQDVQIQDLVARSASREQVAHYMRHTFAHEKSARDGADDIIDGGRVREMGNMSSNQKGGASDLDVFDGLGKKTNTARPPANAPPPPPSVKTNAPPPPPRMPDPNKRTLLGITAPVAPPSISAAAPAPAAPPPASATFPPAAFPPPSSGARTPPPPPGRASLPQVVVPPPKAGGSYPPPFAVRRQVGRAHPRAHPHPGGGSHSATPCTACGGRGIGCDQVVARHWRRHGLGRRG